MGLPVTMVVMGGDGMSADESHTLKTFICKRALTGRFFLSFLGTVVYRRLPIQSIEWKKSLWKERVAGFGGSGARAHFWLLNLPRYESIPQVGSCGKPASKLTVEIGLVDCLHIRLNDILFHRRSHLVLPRMPPNKHLRPFARNTRGVLVALPS